VIADLKPYAVYKDSGLAWLGQVPEHWGTERGKWLFTKMSRPVRVEDDVVTCFRDGTVTLRKNRRLRGFTEAIVEHGYQGIRKGDLVIHGMDAFAGAIGVSDSDGKGTPVYNVCQPRPGVNAWYYSHAVREMSQSQWILALAKGIRERSTDFRYEMFGNQRLPLPPPEEQAAIVRFLDWANARLERTIRAKRRVIALLTEQKQAVIHRAVTRGLDPTVALKPSGITWLGDVPAHWEVRRLRTLVHRIEQGVSPLAVGFLAEGDSWGVLKSGCVNRGTFRQTEHKQLASSFEIDPAIVVKEGDVLISRACGSPTLVGSVGRVKSLQYRLILSDKTFRAAFRSVVDEDFMVFAMNCRYYRQQVEQAISGADGMANNLPLSSLRGFSFAIPPKDEAVAIAAHLESETIVIDRAISRLNREIDLLREYRTRLVADVVTGKLDVRAAAAALPQDELPSGIEPDALDADDDPDALEEAESDDEETAA
jgi:type I restriction enzyme S subunit